MKKEKWMKRGEPVVVGLFTGKIVRVLEWHGEIMFDVEIDGVIDRLKAEDVQPADWCYTMERRASECGCPDCGSSLVYYQEE